MIIEIGIIGFIAILLAGGGLLWHRRRMKRLEIERLEREPKSYDATEIAEDRMVEVGTTVYVGNDSYDVRARDRHCLGTVENGRFFPDEDEVWWVLTLHDDVFNKTLHLSCERDDEGVWEFWTFEDVTEKTVGLEALNNVSFFSEEGPPREFEFRGIRWTAKNDEYDYTVGVRSEHTDRRDAEEYVTQCTEYTGVYVRDGQPAGDELFIELWNARGRSASRKSGRTGMSVSMGRPYNGDVMLFPQDDKTDAA